MRPLQVLRGTYRASHKLREYYFFRVRWTKLEAFNCKLTQNVACYILKDRELFKEVKGRTILRDDRLQCMFGCCLQGSERVHLRRDGAGVLGQPRRQLQAENGRQLVRDVRLRGRLPKGISMDRQSQHVHDRLPAQRYSLADLRHFNNRLYWC